MLSISRKCHNTPLWKSIYITALRQSVSRMAGKYTTQLTTLQRPSIRWTLEIQFSTIRCYQAPEIHNIHIGQRLDWAFQTKWCFMVSISFVVKKKRQTVAVQLQSWIQKRLLSKSKWHKSVKLQPGCLKSHEHQFTVTSNKLASYKNS